MFNFPKTFAVNNIEEFISLRIRRGNFSIKPTAYFGVATVLANEIKISSSMEKLKVRWKKPKISQICKIRMIQIQNFSLNIPIRRAHIFRTFDHA